MRAADWEGRLVAVLRAASRRRFEPKTWNCARFVHACAEAVTGRALPFAFSGGSLATSVDAVFPRTPVPLARRGDIVLAWVPHQTLGVCLGDCAAFVSSKGLLEFIARESAIAWEVE